MRLIKQAIGTVQQNILIGNILTTQKTGQSISIGTNLALFDGWKGTNQTSAFITNSTTLTLPAGKWLIAYHIVLASFNATGYVWLEPYINDTRYDSNANHGTAPRNDVVTATPFGKTLMLSLNQTSNLQFRVYEKTTAITSCTIDNFTYINVIQFT